MCCVSGRIVLTILPSTFHLLTLYAQDGRDMQRKAVSAVYCETWPKTVKTGKTGKTQASAKQFVTFAKWI